MENNLSSACTDKNSLSQENGFVAPANKEADPTTENHRMQPQKKISPGGALERLPREASPEDDENDKSEQIEETRKAKLKVKLEFASFVVLIGLSELSGIMFLPENPANNHLIAIATLGFLALFSGFCLLIHTLFMLAQRNTFPHPIHDTISKSLNMTSWTALVLASVAPVSLLPNPYNLLIPILFVAVLLTLGIHLYLRTKINEKETGKDKTEYEEHMKEITRLSDLSQAVVSLSLGGLIGLLFGIHKNASNAHHPVVLVTTFLTFTSFIFSIFLMPLCQMGVMQLSPKTRKNFLTIGAGLCQFLLVLLAFSAVAISSAFLKWYTIMLFIPVFIVYGVWQSIYLSTSDRNNNQDTIHEEEFKLAYTKANKVTAVSFGVIMAIFSGSLGSNEKIMHMNICMIFMSSSFLSAVVLMLLSYKPSTISHIGLVVSILSYFVMSLLAFGVFIIFILEFMRL